MSVEVIIGLAMISVFIFLLVYLLCGGESSKWEE